MFPVRAKEATPVLPSVGTINKSLYDIRVLLEGDLVKEVMEAENSGPIEFARAFVALRTLKDQIEESLKPFSTLFEDVKGTRLPGKFDAAGIPTVNLDEGFRVTVSHSVRASIKGATKPEAYKWLRDNGLGDLVTETVNSSTLSAVAKSMAEENRELDPELFSVAIMPNTSVTKTKS